MKRMLYVGSSLALLGSVTIGQSYAAHEAAVSNAPMMQVRLCTSTPSGVPALAHLSHGIENGVKLATIQMRALFKAHKMNLLPPLTLNYAKTDGSGYSTDIARQNAIQCVANRTAFGLIGTLNSGAALVAEPYLNRNGMVMVSPANTSPDLTSPAKRRDQEPATANGTWHWPTYYRTVTTDNLQGPAGARYMFHTLHVKKYFLMDDKQTYGAGLAATFDREAKRLGMVRVGIGHIDPSDSSSIATSTDAVTDEIVQKNPDGVYYGGDSETGITLPKRLRAKGFTKPLMGGDALDNTDYLKNAGSRGAVANYATSVGPPINASASKFRSAYIAHFHTALDSYDATSYDAAKIVLGAILRAHARGLLTRGTITKQRAQVARLVGATNYYGAIGHTTFDKNGDTRNTLLTYYKSSGFNWVPAGLAKITGISPAG